MDSDEGKRLYSIGEVGRLTGLQPHVLRFWETEFKELAPQKSDSGRRIYNLKDIDIILRIKKLLYQKKYTIEGAKNAMLEASGDSPRQTQIAFISNDFREVISRIRKELEEILELLD